MHSLSDYDYLLPEQLIAQTPASPPESCKFLVYNQKNQTIHNHVFSDIITLIDPDTLIVFNNSKVLKARLTREVQSSHLSPSKRGTKGESSFPTILEIFYLTSLSPYTFTALVRPGKKFKVGSTIYFNDDISFHIDAITHDGRQITCNKPIFDVLETYGKMPLPPYISYDESKADPYQPVFASKAGSVAAPTASLHFTYELIDQLQSQGAQTAYTTLHV
jgi:S-adenosylmethionine:tRNA ribosyltransferase-isomerase